MNNELMTATQTPSLLGITYTKDYVITEIVDGINGYKAPVWEIVSIECINNKDKNILIDNDKV